MFFSPKKYFFCVKKIIIVDVYETFKKSKSNISYILILYPIKYTYKNIKKNPMLNHIQNLMP